MKKITPLIVVLLALIIGFLCVFGDASYERLTQLKRTLEVERGKNEDLAGSVSELKREVRALQTDPRAVEKAARNELGMARPNEQIFFFDKKE